MTSKPIYREPPQLLLEDAKKALVSGDLDQTLNALLSITLYGEDWKFAQDKCLEFLEHKDLNISCLAATCLGHIARIHGKIERKKVVAALRNHLDNPALCGIIQDALDDIEMFTLASTDFSFPKQNFGAQ